MEASLSYKIRIWLVGTFIFWGMWYCGNVIHNMWEFGTPDYPTQVARR